MSISPGPWAASNKNPKTGMRLVYSPQKPKQPVASRIYNQADVPIIAAAWSMYHALKRLLPHIEAIICYVSTMEEHEPNRIAFDVRAAIDLAENKPVEMKAETSSKSPFDNGIGKFRSKAQDICDQWMAQSVELRSTQALAHKCYASGFNEGYEKGIKQEERKLENAIALSADFHTHKRYDEFYETFAHGLGGFTGIYQLISDMAESMAVLEGTRGSYWDESNSDWITTCERFADKVIIKALENGTIINPTAETLAEVVKELEDLHQRERTV